ncbi:MAG: ribosome maturation factor RimP [Elusimicrobiota bacterium]
MSVTKELTDIVKEEVSRLGYEYVDLNYGRKGKSWFLQVFCDKEGGLTVKDCSRISREVSYELDRHPELFSHSYNLEVSSPGLNRPLKTERDFKRHIGEKVKIKLFAPVNEERIWVGDIVDASEGKAVIKIKDGQKLNLDMENIANAKLEVKI